MSTQVGGRKLPPLVANGDTNDSDGTRDAARKPRRKKKPVDAGSTGSLPRSARDRSSSRTRALPDGPATDADDTLEGSIDSKAARRKMQKTRFDDSQTNEGDDSTVAESTGKPKKKRKKKVHN